MSPRLLRRAAGVPSPRHTSRMPFAQDGQSTATELKLFSTHSGARPELVSRTRTPEMHLVPTSPHDDMASSLPHWSLARPGPRSDTARAAPLPRHGPLGVPITACHGNCCMMQVWRARAQADRPVWGTRSTTSPTPSSERPLLVSVAAVPSRRHRQGDAPAIPGVGRARGPWAPERRRARRSSRRALVDADPPVRSARQQGPHHPRRVTLEPKGSHTCAHASGSSPRQIGHGTPTPGDPDDRRPRSQGAARSDGACSAGIR